MKTLRFSLTNVILYVRFIKTDEDIDMWYMIENDTIGLKKINSWRPLNAALNNLSANEFALSDVSVSMLTLPVIEELVGKLADTSFDKPLRVIKCRTHVHKVFRLKTMFGGMFDE